MGSVASDIFWKIIRTLKYHNIELSFASQTRLFMDRGKKKKNAVPLCSHEQKSFWTLLPLKLYNAFPTKTMKQYQAQQIVGFKEIHGGQWHNDF